MDVQAEIDALRAEIAGLRADIGPLQSSHDSLFRQVANYEASNKHHLQKHHRPRHTVAPSDDPPLILDSYFDDSIRTYFETASNQKETAAPPQSDSLTSIQDRTRQGSYALIESIHRFGGITAFPINDALYDTSEDALLGLRFDILSHSSNAFLPSHYVILRRVLSKDQRHNWLVFRYTTPAYISLDSYKHHLTHQDEAHGLQKFCECIRAALVATQYRHDTINSISQLTYGDFGLDPSNSKVFVSSDTDMQCRRVVLALSDRKYSIELLLGSKSIDSVSSTLPNRAALHISALLSNATIESLRSAFSQALTYLRHESLI